MSLTNDPTMEGGLEFDLRELQEENDRLHAELAQAKHLLALANDEVSDLVAINVKTTDERDAARAQVEALREQYLLATSKINRLSAELDACENGIA